MRLLLLFVITFQVLGCSTITPEFNYYGNFCGAGNPEIPEGMTKNEAIDYLEGTPTKPYDEIDLVCKKHDICYERNGGPSLDCDRELISAIETPLYIGKNRMSCINVSNDILYYFVFFHPKDFGDAKENIFKGTMLGIVGTVYVATRAITLRPRLHEGYPDDTEPCQTKTTKSFNLKPWR